MQGGDGVGAIVAVGDVEVTAQGAVGQGALHGVQHGAVAARAAGDLPVFVHHRDGAHLKLFPLVPALMLAVMLGNKLGKQIGGGALKIKGPGHAVLQKAQLTLAGEGLGVPVVGGIVQDAAPEHNAAGFVNGDHRFHAHKLAVIGMIGINRKDKGAGFIRLLCDLSLADLVIFQRAVIDQRVVCINAVHYSVASL